MPQQRRRLRLTVPALIVLVAVVAIPLLFAGTSSSRFCSLCHQSASPSTDIGGAVHNDRSCYSCHLERGWIDWPAAKFREFTRMYPKALLGKNEPAGPGVRVASGVCLRCHGDVLAQTVERGGFRMAHKAMPPSATCDSCHSAHPGVSRWVREPVMEECVSCHAANGASTKCDLCHEAKPPSARLTKGPWQVTHGPGWATNHGAGTLQYCVTCHEKGFCENCHKVPMPHPADFGGTHGDYAKKTDARCNTCHSEQTFCLACHQVPMPHPSGFFGDHSSVATGYEDERCLKCHDKESCWQCHIKHIHPGRPDDRVPLKVE